MMNLANIVLFFLLLAIGAIFILDNLVIRYLNIFKGQGSAYFKTIVDLAIPKSAQRDLRLKINWSLFVPNDISKQSLQVKERHHSTIIEMTGLDDCNFQNKTLLVTREDIESFAIKLNTYYNKKLFALVLILLAYI